MTFVTNLLIISVISQLFNGFCSAVRTTKTESKSSLNAGPMKNRSVFTLVRFLNIPCSSANGQMSGICFSLNDCLRLQGTQIGTCASGFGVCCIFQRTCGTATSQNVTHFTSPGFPGELTESEFSTCTLTLLRPNRVPICQIRLDFVDFDLVRPTDGSCLDDKFSVLGSNLNSPVPEICGYNAGQHMYIDVENTAGPIPLTVTTRGLGKRKWNIKVLFIECTNPAKAPPNCLQHYTGERGTFSSFNYIPGQTSVQSGGYLNNMNYAICFRKEAGFCSQTYTTMSTDRFVLLNLNPNTSPTVGGGEAGLGVTECPQDYLRLGGDRYCGARLNPSTGNNPGDNAPVVDYSNGPITTQFVTDGANNAVGFRLQYNQNTCNNRPR